MGRKRDPEKVRREKEEKYLNGRRELIANNIRKLRKENKITFRHLQETTGYAPANFLRYERGDIKHIHREALEKIADTFCQVGVHCTVSDLLKDDYTATICVDELVLSPYERKTLMWFDKLNAIGQARAIEYLKDIAKVPAYQNRNSDVHKLKED